MDNKTSGLTKSESLQLELLQKFDGEKHTALWAALATAFLIVTVAIWVILLTDGTSIFKVSTLAAILYCFSISIFISFITQGWNAQKGYRQTRNRLNNLPEHLDELVVAATAKRGRYYFQIALQVALLSNDDYSTDETVAVATANKLLAHTQGIKHPNTRLFVNVRTDLITPLLESADYRKFEFADYDWIPIVRILILGVIESGDQDLPQAALEELLQWVNLMVEFHELFEVATLDAARDLLNSIVTSQGAIEAYEIYAKAAARKLLGDLKFIHNAKISPNSVEAAYLEDTPEQRLSQ